MEYVTVSGDSIEMLGKLFIVSEAEIRRLNGLAPGAEPLPGMTLLIPPFTP